MTDHEKKEFANKTRTLLLESLKFVQTFFEEHNLRWFAGCGTLLGAIREKGFIPWDDDVDIYMPRSDYERLMELRDSLESANYSIINYSPDNNYFLPYAKLINTHTTIWETKRCPCVFGVFIDIFPLDYFGPEYTREDIIRIQARDFRIFDIYRRHTFHYSVKDLFKLALNGYFPRIAWYFVDRIDNWLGGKKRLLRKYDRLHRELARNDEKTSPFCTFTYGPSGKIYETSWFSSVVMMPFEDMLLPCPCGYDNYLKVQYGDYMTRPPKEAQVSVHNQYYVNLSEGLDLKAAKERIECGETYRI